MKEIKKDNEKKKINFIKKNKTIRKKTLEYSLFCNNFRV